MKNLPFILLLFVCLLLSSYKTDAQYFTAIGARSGPPAGISFKQFSHRYRGNAIELMLTSYQIGNLDIFGYMFTALYEHQKRLPYFKSLCYPFDFFYGVGVHGGYYSDYVLLGSGDASGNTRIFSVGPDAIIGLERKFQRLPLTLGVDIHPYYEVTIKKLMMEKAAITIRYVFE